MWPVRCLCNGQYPGPTSVYPRGCRNFGHSGVCPRGAISGTTSINLDSFRYLTNAAVLALVEHFPGAISVSLLYCESLTDAAVVFLAGHSRAAPRWAL